jgi:hypothetical protein
MVHFPNSIQTLEMNVMATRAGMKRVVSNNIAELVSVWCEHAAEPKRKRSN